ncbi:MULTISPECIES: LysR substrate-binding domain-containing protein [Mesorhizobium]|uniref:LysR substrate-binding domain-containing protein n=11 Tax=Mesorhizobium TaxID=68287 RepID=A0AB38T8R6_9HYPH|nr:MULTISPECIES: LysR substrate-binding domain-containing protein [Mesorhizobium]MDF3216551.1 LysR substrate-binding domain-containing protein [Mesorhizobium ciceri]RUY70963.1 LysR family transcriptional regulator [Mesorhizobium sp. M7A.F.Ca.CA.001.13.1.1]RUZ18273.1 LysR family transcriptional regulator [Mesorhizobium sp. M7A.F.Ca.CA.001.09.1.1]RUZ28058.1 LysR family transcriptional regulator [Mesorhizobium sp. M7A.F.Ca.CA.001.04.1.1]UTU50803.1 LysR substrate-binding domain-containing protein 
METLDPDLLRTFLAFVDSGSLAQAAASIGRSPSAVTAQMQRLEEIVGEPLLAPQGRGRGLTPAGEDLVGHAKRILAAHREAWLALKGARAAGRVAIGTTQDFADSGLPDLLRAFAGSHPRVRIELRVGRSAELAQALQSGGLDLAIVMRQTAAPDEVGVLREPMIWLCSQKGLATRQAELPLALLDPYCGFREAALAALDAAGRRYRIAAGSASLAGLRTAVNAGVALTLRTARFAHSGIIEAPRELGLPQVPLAEFAIRLRAGADGPAADLATLLSGNLALSG